MQAIVTLDDLLVARAESLTGLRTHSALLREALNALIERESERHTETLDRPAATLHLVPRRRSGT
jgi:Arc/MetJ family transcription regulator